MKKRLYKVEAFAHNGVQINDNSFKWIIDEVTGWDAIKFVKEQVLGYSRGYSDKEVKSFSFSATYLKDC